MVFLIMKVIRSKHLNSGMGLGQSGKIGLQYLIVNIISDCIKRLPL
jgi:hypothetical protein